MTGSPAGNADLVPPELAQRLLDEARAWSRARPLVVGIAGPSGVGKSTLTRAVRELLAAADLGVRTISVDDFFKHPRERALFGEWSPDHVRFEELRRVLGCIAAGESAVETEQYRRLPEKSLYPWTIDLAGVCVVVLEGLYAVSDELRLGGLLEFVDLPVFIDGDEKDRKRWRFEQEAAKPISKDAAAMEKHWQEGIVPDTRDNVLPSRANARILLRVDSDHRLRVERMS